MPEGLLVGGWVVTGVNDRESANVLRDAAVVHRDGVIVEVGPTTAMRGKYPHASVEGSADHAILPGFVNSHHHVGVTPLQLGTPDCPLELWLPNRLSARAVDLYLDTLYSAFEMIASGVTTVQHLFAWMPTGSLEQLHDICTRILEAYRAIGVRASFSYMARNQNRVVYEPDAEFLKKLPPETAKALAAFLAKSEAPFEQLLTLFEMLRKENEAENLTRIQLAPANLQWCSDDALLELKRNSDLAGVPMHMHLLETPYQKEYARRRTGTTAVKHLEKLGLLGPSMTLGHGVWLTEEDVEIVASTGTSLCHNCSSNFRLRSGMAPVNACLSKGIHMGMGMDEAGINDDRDMLQEMRMVLRTNRVPGLREDEIPSCPDVLRMATEHGGMTTAFGAAIGKLESGRFADAVMVNVKRAFYPYQDDDVPMLDALLQRAKTDSVDAVFVNGNKIYENGIFTFVDRDKVLAELAEALSRPRTEAENHGRELRRLVVPHVEAFYRDYLADTKDREPFPMGKR